jgi:hypothetical protein
MVCIATFHTASMAIMFERTCRKEGIRSKIVPVPRSLSVSCGLACEFPCKDMEHIKQICETKKIEMESFHEV